MTYISVTPRERKVTSKIPLNLNILKECKHWKKHPQEAEKTVLLLGVFLIDVLIGVSVFLIEIFE